MTRHDGAVGDTARPVEKQGRTVVVAHRGAEVELARRRRSLRVVIGALSALVGVVAVLGTWQVLAARSSQRTQILDGELTAARLAGNTVSSTVESRLQLLENLAGQPGASSFVDPAAASSLDPLLAELLRLYPEFSNISVTDRAGALVAQAPDWPSSPAIAQTRHELYATVSRSGKGFVTDVFEEPSGALAVTAGAAVKDASGHFIGSFQAAVPISTISAAVGGTSLSAGGTLLIADQSGHMLTGPAAGNRSLFASNSVIASALAGASGTSTSRVPGFSDERLVAYAPVRSLRWAVVVEYPQATLGGPVTALTERLAGIGAAVVLFSVATAVVLWLLLRQLGRQRDEVTAMFASVGEGVATVDAGGRVLKVNPALERLSGRHAQRIQGRPWAEAIAVHDEEGHGIPWEDTVVAQAIETRRVVASRGFGLSLTSADGGIVPVAMTAAPLFIDTAAPSGAVVVVRDVSREKEVDRLKSSLVSTVSHELRTPLTLIQGFSELLMTRTNIDSSQSVEALGQIHASSQRLGRLIDDLLSVSRIESGHLTTDLGSIELSEVVSEVLSSFEVSGGHRFVTDLAEDLSPVLADRDKTVQVLTNLVSNAVKYSPTGSEVLVKAFPVDDHAEIVVRDQGVGMTTAETQGVFEKFTRSDRPEVRKVGGTGLGLYITRSLVELQGGRVWIHSEPGRGTSVTFTLPLDLVLTHKEAPCEHC